MQTTEREVTKLELLLAISMSMLHQTTHVMFLPPNTSYSQMLLVLKNTKFIEPMGEKFFKLTDKGFKYVKRRYAQRSRALDKEIDAFVDNL